MVWKELIEGLTDDFISVGMTITILYMVIMQIPVPEFLIGAFGLILAFYYKK